MSPTAVLSESLAASPATGLPQPVMRKQALSLAAAGLLALVLLAGACLLALYLFFESGTRDRLHTHLQQARVLLARVDHTAALSSLPARLHDSFASLPDLAVRIQGAYGQPLYEQGVQSDMPPALLASPALAPPAPLMQWRADDGRAWRGSAMVVRMPMDGASPLTVAVALDVQRQQAFIARLAWAVAAYVLLAAALLGWLARKGRA